MPGRFLPPRLSFLLNLAQQKKGERPSFWNSWWKSIGFIGSHVTACPPWTNHSGQRTVPLAAALNDKPISGIRGLVWLTQKHMNWEWEGRWFWVNFQRGCKGSRWQKWQLHFGGGGGGTSWWDREKDGGRRSTRGVRKRPTPSAGQRKKIRGFPKIVSCPTSVHFHRVTLNFGPQFLNCTGKRVRSGRWFFIQSIHQNYLESSFQVT